MHLLAFAASHRKDSVNQKLVSLAIKEAEAKGITVTTRNYAEYDMPLYDDDRFLSHGLPDGGERLKQDIDAADGFIIALPEYNWSYPGHLKNAVDWISRCRPVPFKDKTCMLMAASPSIMGGIKGLLHFRVPLEALGTYVMPRMFTLANAYDAIGKDGAFTDEANCKRLNDCVDAFIDYTRKLKG